MLTQKSKDTKMIYTNLTKRALMLAFDAHKDQTDKSGMPYVFHPFHLAESMTDEISTVCALLHDVIEDTDITFDDLLSHGFPIEVIEILKLLTHKDGMDYMDYVRNIAKNPIARAVKLADLKHNSDLTRLDTPTEWDLRRQNKYIEALKILTNVETVSENE